MSILTFQRPDKVIMLEINDSFGKFEFRPLEPGYGITVGNTLRRVLLSSLEGYAITNIKITGVDHEFATIKGVIEDMTEIILNIKQIRFKKKVDADESEKVTVTISGKKQFVADDISHSLSNFEILNKDLVLCNMEPNVKLQIDLWINKGRGYVPSDENKVLDGALGVIPIDAIFTPMKNVRYYVENYRVEQKTDFEKLIFEIKTDGSIHPKEALRKLQKS